jgi:predicted CopG family antitoxin
MKRIYVSDEAYEELVKYCLARYKSLRVMSKVASELLVDAIKQRAEQEAR